MKCDIKILGQLQRRYALEMLSQIPDEPIHEVIIRPYRKSKSQEQLAYLYGVVLKTIQQHIEDTTGDHYTVDDIYNWMIEEYGEAKVVNIGGVDKLTKLTASRMNVKQMSEFIERVVQHAAVNMDLHIPDAVRI